MSLGFSDLKVCFYKFFSYFEVEIKFSLGFIFAFSTV